MAELPDAPRFCSECGGSNIVHNPVAKTLTVQTTNGVWDAWETHTFLLVCPNDHEAIARS